MYSPDWILNSFWLFAELTCTLKERRFSDIEEDKKNVVAALVLIPKEKLPNISSIGSTFRQSELVLSTRPL
jgi:hypothetical protein